MAMTDFHSRAPHIAVIQLRVLSQFGGMLSLSRNLIAESSALNELLFWGDSSREIDALVSYSSNPPRRILRASRTRPTYRQKNELILNNQDMRKMFETTLSSKQWSSERDNNNKVVLDNVGGISEPNGTSRARPELTNVNSIGQAFSKMNLTTEEESVAGTAVSRSTIGGLENLGATCYMNTILQCLFATPVIQNIMSTESNNTTISQDTLQSIFTKLYHAYQRESNLAKRECLNTLASMFCRFYKTSLTRHQDAMEFFTFLLSGFAECEKFRKAFETTVTFKRVCTKCNTSTSELSNVTLYWHIPVTRNIFESIAQFFWKGPTEKSYCAKCRGNQDQKEVFEKINLPDVLVLAFHRSSMSTTVGSPVSPVNDSRLIRSPFVLNFEKAFGDYGELFFNGGDKKNKLLYDLYAIVNHSGNTEAGHYTASIHHKGDWWDCNDSIVQQKDNKDRRITPNSYALFYKRRLPSSHSI